MNAASLPASAHPGGHALALPAASVIGRQNWPLYLFVALIPLQNLYLAHLPNPGGGLNFVNIMFLLCLATAWHCRGRLVAGTGVNGWVFAYMGLACVSLVVGFSTVADPSGHVNDLKDQLIAVSFLFLAQMSATDWRSVRRLFWFSLLPIPWMFWVVLDQSSKVGSDHYSDDLRINGTFIELGANEMAAFFVTTALVCLAVALAVRTGSWKRGILLGMAGLAAACVVLSYSRTAYVAILAGLALVLLLPGNRARLLVPTLVLAAALPFLIPQAAVERFDAIVIEEGERDESTENRLIYWQVALERFAERPLLGTGYHTFHHPEVNPHEIDAHNLYLRELAEKGLPGGIVLAGLLYVIGRLSWRGFRAARPGTWLAGLTLAMTAVWTALLIGNLTGDRFTHAPMIAHFWLYVGLTLRALDLTVMDRRRAAESAA